MKISGPANFDGLVGPTHKYAGISAGNVASLANRRKPSNPKEAALQGLEKMRRVSALGIAQAVMPPQERPDLEWLRRLGFTGTDAAVLARAAREDPALLAAAASASAMWTANAATVSPSRDSGDGRLHLTPANLASQHHRSLEPAQTAALLKRLFPGDRFTHHLPLPPGRVFGDEGAANHVRLTPGPEGPGIQIFVYGHEALRTGGPGPRRFPARQSLEACRALARLHGLDPARTVFARQNPAAIDAGVFHNDVISVGDGGFFFVHAAAFHNQAKVLGEIRGKYAALGRGPLQILEVKARQVSLKDAVATYLFNSQLLSPPGRGRGRVLLAAEECRRHPRVRAYLESLTGKESPVASVEYADLRQSMRNGGGPACLRLGVTLTPEEWGAVPAGVKYSDALHLRLEKWVRKHYRDRIIPRDLADPTLLRESRVALDELTVILGLGALYPFQR